MTPEEFRARATLAVAPVEPQPDSYAWLRDNVARRRVPALPVVAGTAAVVAATVGIAALAAPGSPAPASPAAGRSATPSPSASSKPDRDDRTPGEYATTREEFLPLLERANGTLAWPPDYPMSAEFIWDKLEGLAVDSTLTNRDALGFTRFNNLCAWTMQLIDDDGSRAATSTDIHAIDSLAKAMPDLDEMIERITSGARRGDLTQAKQVVFANGCARGFVPDDQISPPFMPGGG